MLFARRRHRHPRRRPGKTLRVGGGAKQRRAAVGQPIGFQPLKNFLRVMQHQGRRVEGKRLARRDFGVMPAVLFRILDDGHVVGKHLAKAWIRQQFLTCLHTDRRRIFFDNKGLRGGQVHGGCSEGNVTGR